jgi:hypothetical protein
MVNKNGDYYKWKAGKEMYKAPWIYKYYESVTDENQYDLSNIVIKRFGYIVGLAMFILGVLLGLLIKI